MLLLWGAMAPMRVGEMERKEGRKVKAKGKRAWKNVMEVEGMGKEMMGVEGLKGMEVGKRVKEVEERRKEA